MSYRKSTKSNFASILSSLVILMLVALVVGFLFVRTDGLTTGYKQFYVQCGNDTFMQDRENFSIVLGREYKFDIHNESDSITRQESSYQVKVVPNAISSTTFSFSVDGTTYNYGDLTSLSSQFVINAYDDYFTFKAIDDLTEIMQDKYNTENVVGCPTALNSGLPYFRIVITNVDNSENININFNIKSE